MEELPVSSHSLVNSCWFLHDVDFSQRACISTDVVVRVEGQTTLFCVEQPGHTTDLCMLTIDCFLNIVTRKQYVQTKMRVGIVPTQNSAARRVFGACNMLLVWKNQKISLNLIS